MSATQQRAFRDCLGAFATGVTIITTVTPDGELIGNTASSFNSVSLDPPLILWSLARQAKSLRAYLSADHFAVNVLREGQEEVSNNFARQSPEKWHGVDYRIGVTGCPVLPGALAVMECRIAHSYAGGDHMIFIGEVEHFHHDPAGRPLIFWRGRYRHFDPASVAADQETGT